MPTTTNTTPAALPIIRNCKLQWSGGRTLPPDIVTGLEGGKVLVDEQTGKPAAVLQRQSWSAFRA